MSMFETTLDSYAHSNGLKDVNTYYKVLFAILTMLQAKSPEAFITTHPAVVEAVINIVKDAGAVPMLGDSPGGPARGMEKFWEITGFANVCKRTGTQLVNFEKSGFYEFERKGRTYRVARPVIDADVIINMQDADNAAKLEKVVSTSVNYVDAEGRTAFLSSEGSALTLNESRVAMFLNAVASENGMVLSSSLVMETV